MNYMVQVQMTISLVRHHSLRCCLCAACSKTRKSNTVPRLYLKYMCRLYKVHNSAYSAEKSKGERALKTKNNLQSFIPLHANIRILNAANIAEKIWQLQDAVIGHVEAYHIEASEKTSGGTLQKLVYSFIVHKIYWKIFSGRLCHKWQETRHSAGTRWNSRCRIPPNRVNGDISVSSGRNGH